MKLLNSYTIFPKCNKHPESCLCVFSTTTSTFDVCFTNSRNAYWHIYPQLSLFLSACSSMETVMMGEAFNLLSQKPSPSTTPSKCTRWGCWSKISRCKKINPTCLLWYEEVGKVEYPNIFIFRKVAVTYFLASKIIQRDLFNGVLIAIFKQTFFGRTDCLSPMRPSKIN